MLLAVQRPQELEWRGDAISESKSNTQEGAAANRSKHLIRYYGDFLPSTAVRAEGAYVYDQDDRAILDFTSGQMGGILGHSHPEIVQTLERASKRLIHLSSGMLSPPVIELAERLSDLLPPSLSKVLLLSTGAESNEAALRLAKLFTGGFEVVGLDASWHGMTGGVAACTFSAGRKGYGPGMPGVMALPTPNRYRRPAWAGEGYELDILDMAFETLDRQGFGAYAATLVEPILSAGGMVEPPPGYLAKLKQMCVEREMLLILDEAQTGLGRTGKMFAFEHHDVVPDILTLSKTLGAGLPLSATITSEEIEERCHERGFLFVTTHVSDPLPATVGLTVLDIILRDQLAERAVTLGDYLLQQLRELQDRHECIGDVRGRGLMVGVEMVADRRSKRHAPELGAAISRRCLELGLNMNIVHLPEMGGVFRIAPPLVIRTEEIDLAVEIFDRSIRDTLDRYSSAVGR